MNLTGRRLLLVTILVGVLASDAAAQALDHTPLLTPSGRRELLNGSRTLQAPPPRVDDSVGDGITIGALAGAGIAAGLMAWAYAQCDGSCDAPARGPMFLSAMSMGAGVGAVTGWVIDKLHKGKGPAGPVVAPIVTKDRKGLALSMRF
jgi:hypothetical protein